MTLWACVAIAFRALRVNKLRSALTMLGIVIGVAAVIAMVAVGVGAQERVNEQIRSLGANIMIVVSGTVTSGGVHFGLGSQLTLTDDDADAMARDVAGIKATAAVVRGAAQVVYGNLNWSTAIYGVESDYLQIRDWNVAAGRTFTQQEQDRAAKVALLGQTVARSLFGGADPINQVIRIKRVPFIVIGLLDKKGQSLMGQDQDDAILMPLSTARNRVLGASQAGRFSVGSIMVKMDPDADMRATEAETRALLRQRHHLQPAQDDDFWIRNLSEVLQAQQAASRALALLLAAVASVSLVVGGIGIMNIMLVSVTERTREIGLRMAVGARARDILTQFLVEAVILALIGGFAGIVLGVAVSLAAGTFAGWRTEISPGAILMAVGFASLVGVFFGFYPARKASRLLPIEALRYE
ncbi:MAG: ABC transporter permease [Alphaproteobacteria bacterium]